MDDKLSPIFSPIEPQENNSTELEEKKDQQIIWVSVSEAARLGGVQDKTIRRAIKANTIRYKVVGNRYQINLYSLLVFLHQKTKLRNKLNQSGIGQYVDKWKL